MIATVFILAGFAEHVQAWMERYGYFALFGVLFSCGLGFPLPEDVPLLIAGAFVSTGRMNLALAAIAAWCGIIGGDVVLYHLGKLFGQEVKRLPVIGRHLDENRIDQVHGMFERWGVWVIAVGRMFAGIRGTMVVVAGSIRFTFWKFLLADGLAAIVSGGIFLGLGYAFARRMDWLKEHVERGKKWSLLIVFVLAIIGAIWIYYRQRAKRRVHDKGDRHRPAGAPGDAPHDTPAHNAAAESSATSPGTL